MDTNAGKKLPTPEKSRQSNAHIDLLNNALIDTPSPPKQVSRSKPIIIHSSTTEDDDIMNRNVFEIESSKDERSISSRRVQWEVDGLIKKCLPHAEREKINMAAAEISTTTGPIQKYSGQSEIANLAYSMVYEAAPLKSVVDYQFFKHVRLYTGKVNCFLFFDGTFQCEFQDSHKTVVICPRMETVTFDFGGNNRKTYSVELLEQHGCDKKIFQVLITVMKAAEQFRQNHELF